MLVWSALALRVDGVEGAGRRTRPVGGRVAGDRGVHFLANAVGGHGISSRVCDRSPSGRRAWRLGRLSKLRTPRGV